LGIERLGTGSGEEALTFVSVDEADDERTVRAMRTGVRSF
jgi:hypothetical protein